MHNLSDRLDAFVQLRDQLAVIADENRADTSSSSALTQTWNALVEQQCQQNKWFIPQFSNYALETIVKTLHDDALSSFAQKYDNKITENDYTIAVISAGNIPMAAFHDLFSILVSGNRYQGKLSQHDQLLLPFVAQLLTEVSPSLGEKIVFTEKLSGYDKIIANGSNNSARYFEYYFKNVPLLLRRHRNSVAVLSGKESREDLDRLCYDLFTYFGLGCRSVSKILLPQSYDFQLLQHAILAYYPLIAQHHSYQNNLDYQKVIMLMNQVPFIDVGTALLVENNALASPIGVVHYEFYNSMETLEMELQQQRQNIQCIVSQCNSLSLAHIPFGTAQTPNLLDFADGKDTVLFCAN